MWNKIVEELKKTDYKEIKTFIEAFYPEKQTREEIIIKCKSKYAFEFFKKNNYLSKIEKTVKNLFDESTKVEFIVVAENEEKNNNEETTPEDNKKVQLEIDFKDKEKHPKNNEKMIEEYEKYEDFTFDNFVIGPSNATVYHAAQTIAKNPGTGYNPFFVYGDSGLGKTHIIHAIGNYIIRNKNKRVYYSTTDNLINDYIKSVETQTVPDFRKKIIKNDVLLIDDIQFLSKKEGTQNEFFYIFNHFYDNKKQIVITSDKYITEINDINNRLRSRFAMGVSLDITPPEYETRVAIVKKKAELFDLKIDDEVIDFIASNIKNNIRELEGALRTLKISCGFIGQETIDMKFAANMLKDKIRKKPTDVEDIIKIVSSSTGVKPSDIISQKRTRAISLSRQIAIYITKKFTTKTYKEIGEKFGGRDHSTIITSVSNIEKLILDDNHIANKVEEISNKIEELKVNI